MATDMADDEKAVNSEGFNQADPPTSGAAGETPKPVSPSGRPLDWTASDARGPLVTAADGQGAIPGVPTTDAGAETSHEPVPEHPLKNVEPELGQTESVTSAAKTEHVRSEDPKKRSLLPVAAALVVGALIGAGSAAVVYNASGSSATSDPQVAGLSSRVDALEKRPDTQGAVDSLKIAVADLGAQVAAMRKSAATPVIGSAPATPGPSAPPVDLAPIQQKIADLQASLDAVKAQSGDIKGVEAKLAALESEIAAAKTERSSAQASITNVEGQQKLLADKVMVPALAVVADSLVQQIDQGQPYAAQVDALTTLGADPAKVAILRQNAGQGVPSAQTLAAKFEPLAEPISATAHKAPPNAGFMDRLKTGMFSMVSIRSADDTSGADLPSRVARIKADLAHDDIADALATWDALPPDAKAKGEAWGALAKTSVDAMGAARALQHDAITGLGAKKS